MARPRKGFIHQARATSVALTTDQLDDLRRLATQRLTSVSQVIREMVATALEAHKRDAGRSHGR